MKMKKNFKIILTILITIFLISPLSSQESKNNNNENNQKVFSIFNQNTFTKAPGKLTQITVGKKNEIMSIFGIGLKNDIYQFDLLKNNWISKPKLNGIKQIIIADDGTLGGINKKGLPVLWKNSEWQPVANSVAEQFDIADKNNMVYLQKGKIYKTNVAGKKWNELATNGKVVVTANKPGQMGAYLDKGKKSFFTSVSMGTDGTIVATTNKFRVFYWDEDHWEKITGTIKKVAVGSKTNIWGIDAQDTLTKLNLNSGIWEKQKNLVALSNSINKPIRVSDVSVNSDGNVWAVTQKQPEQYEKNEIISNVAINTTEALTELRNGTIVLIRSLSEDKYLQIGDKNYIHVDATDPEDKKAHFEIVRSLNEVGFKATTIKNGFIQPSTDYTWQGQEEGFADNPEENVIYRPTVLTNKGFGSWEQWLIKGELEQAFIENKETKFNLSAVSFEAILENYKNKMLAWHEKRHDDMHAGTATLGTIGLVSGGALGTGAITAGIIEASRASSNRAVEEHTTVPEYLKGIIAMTNTKKEKLEEMFAIIPLKLKEEILLPTNKNQFKDEYKFSTPGHGHIKFQTKGTGPLFIYLWNKNKKLLMPIVIGGNNNKTVAVGTESGWQTFVKEDAIFDPTTFKNFWLTIKNNAVTFGIGSIISQNTLGTSPQIQNLKSVKFFTLSRLEGAKLEIMNVIAYGKLLGEKEEVLQKEATEELESGTIIALRNIETGTFLKPEQQNYLKATGKNTEDENTHFEIEKKEKEIAFKHIKTGLFMQAGIEHIWEQFGNPVKLMNKKIIPASLWSITGQKDRAIIKNKEFKQLCVYNVRNKIQDAWETSGGFTRAGLAHQLGNIDKQAKFLGNIALASSTQETPNEMFEIVIIEKKQIQKSTIKPTETSEPSKIVTKPVIEKTKETLISPVDINKEKNKQKEKMVDAIKAKTQQIKNEITKEETSKPIEEKEITVKDKTKEKINNKPIETEAKKEDLEEYVGI